MVRIRFLGAALALAVATPAAAQQGQQAQQPRPQQVPRAMASTRATVEVQLTHRQIGGQWFNTGAAGATRIAIEYGQPHLRGRQLSAVVPMDSVWRLGANVATHLTTDVDLTIGGQFVPRGVYSLFALPTRAGWRLIVNRQVHQWGTEYDATADVARIDLRARTTAEPVESLSIYLVPTVEPQPAQGQAATPSMPRGTLRIVWGTTELTTDWRVGR